MLTLFEIAVFKDCGCSSGSDSSISLFGRRLPIKTPPLDRADNGRPELLGIPRPLETTDVTTEPEAPAAEDLRTPGSLGYWSQGLRMPGIKVRQKSGKWS